MGLIVKHADGSEFLNIENKTYDDTSTSLKLPGKGVLNWGEAYASNFVHIMENFASSTEPRSPQVGQLWYNTGSGVLAVYTVTHEWEVVNKDTDIEEKFDILIERIRESNAGPVPPDTEDQGRTWFDTNVNIFKVYDGQDWVALGFHSIAAYIEPTGAHESDLWFDKNIKQLKVHDGDKYQRVASIIESIHQPANIHNGQWWHNTSTGQFFVYLQEPSTGDYYWKEIGSNNVTEGPTPPATARTGAFHITREPLYNILYVNKGSKNDPIWTEIPEHGGAIKSVNEPARVLDGMFWLDGNDILKVRKNKGWVDIDETAISYVSAEEPENVKEGMVWFDTTSGFMKIKINGIWEYVQNIGLITHGNAPSSPVVGQLWYDDSSGDLFIWSSSVWSQVNGGGVIVSYMQPVQQEDGQLWLDTTESELKIKKSGGWASLPHYARANSTVPTNPKVGDIAYINDKLKVFDGILWKDINVSVQTDGGSNVSYDEISHEIVISDSGVVTRVPLAIKRDIIVENVGITSDLVEVVKPDIKDGERRIIDIQKVNLNRQFFVFKNGLFTDNWSVDAQDLILHSANGEDEIDVMQFNGDISINYLVKKFKSNVNGNFTINNYTRTEEEQVEYDAVKAQYDAKKDELIAAHTTDDQDADEEDLTEDDWAILNAIEATFPIKESNMIADLSLGGIMVFKEGVFIPTSDLTINEENENNIIIPNTNVGEIYTIVQLIAGRDYKSAFFSKEYAFKIGEEEDTTDKTTNVKGKMMSDMLNAASKNTLGYGHVEVPYDYSEENKEVTFELIDIDTDYHFFVTRNNLFVSPTNYTVDTVDKRLTMYANNQDDIRFFQFYLPHNYVPVEFNYKQGLAEADGWITLDLNRDFDLNAPLMVFRNGFLQEEANINVIIQETITDEDGNDYTVTGLRRVQLFGDAETNDEAVTGVQTGDIVTVMQVSQPEMYHIFLEEFGVLADGANIFEFTQVNGDRDFFVYRNGMKLGDDEYYVNDNGRLIVENCNGPTVEELADNPDAFGDLLIVSQFYTKDTLATDDLSYTEEVISATVTGSENFQLLNTEFVNDEFLLVFKNGQMITRRQPEGETSTQDQINTYKVFADRVYHNTTPAIDPTGNPIYDSEGNPVINIDPDDYTDVMAFNIDNVVAGEEVDIFEFNKKVTNVNSLTSETHYEILPNNNLQRIYTTKYDQLTNLTMIFQDGDIIDRTVDNMGNDTVRENGMLRLLDQYAVDNTNASIIVNDWKVGGKIRVQQLTASSKDIKTVALTVVVVVDGTFDVFLPNNELYTPNAGALEVYVDKVIQWSGDDYIEVANNRIMFTRQLMKDQVVKIFVRH